MTNAEAASRLGQAEEEAFLPWKALIAAIRAFYAEDEAGLIDALARISDSSPPAALKPLFLAWVLLPETPAAETLSEASAAVAALHRRLMTEIHPAANYAEQAEEALRQGMVEHFETLACRTIRELHESPRADGPLLSLRGVARCLALLDDAGEDDGAFFAAVLKTIGRADGLTALGLAMVERDESAAVAAFRGAIADNGPRAFLNDAAKEILKTAIDILEESSPKADKAMEGRARRPRQHHAVPGQLDLF